MLLSILFFILAGLAEIGGGYLVWLYMRDDKRTYLPNHRCFYFILIWHHPYLPAEASFGKVYCIRRRIYCPLYSMGLACGRLTTRHVRYHRRSRMPCGFISSCMHRVKYAVSRCAIIKFIFL